MIDWSFIEAREGRRLVGYVPDPRDSKSGVTVGVGVDIGHLTDQEFLSIPDALRKKIEPYRHLTGLAALVKIRALPLMLDTFEVDTLDKIIFAEISGELREDYDRVTHQGAFDSLPGEAQTVMTSVAFQYGVLASKCPHFWRECVARDWSAAVAELNNFGDGYGPRRKIEAGLLAKLLAPQA